MESADKTLAHSENLDFELQSNEWMLFIVRRVASLKRFGSP